MAELILYLQFCTLRGVVCPTLLLDTYTSKATSLLALLIPDSRCMAAIRTLFILPFQMSARRVFSEGASHLADRRLLADRGIFAIVSQSWMYY
jgi:hypothetical protein